MSNNPFAIPADQQLPLAEDCQCISASWDTDQRDIRGTLLELDRKQREQQGMGLPNISLGIRQVKRIATKHPDERWRQAAREFLTENFPDVPLD